MDASFRVSSAEELLDTEFIAKWQDRKAIDPLARRVLEAVLKRFVADGGPVPAEALESDFPATSRWKSPRLSPGWTRRT